MNLYPQIFFACHTRHVADPKTRRVLSARMSVAVDRLTALGYVIRTRDALDARRVRLLLSAAGLRIRESKSVLDPGRVRSMLSRLGPRQRAEALSGRQEIRGGRRCRDSLICLCFID